MSSEDLLKEAREKYRDWVARGRPKEETNPENVARFGKHVFGPSEDKSDEQK